jgi:hypothetical protein
MMKLKMKVYLVASIFVAFTFLAVTTSYSLADPKWDDLLEQGQLKQGMVAALTAGISVGKISKTALDLKYPVCDILDAELSAEIDAYQALKTLIVAGGDLEHLARCCAEPGIRVSPAVFARAAIDAGVEQAVLDRLLSMAFNPPPGERGAPNRESVVAGGEIREGPYTSHDAPD